MSDEGHYNRAAVLEWIVSLFYIFYQWSFAIDFLPATQTKNKNDRYLPPVRRKDDEMAINTEAGGNQLGGPVYTSGGSDGSVPPSYSANGRHNAGQQNVAPSQNF